MQFESYKSIVNYLRNGVRVKDLESDILRNMEAFGPANAFFEEDKWIVISFCDAVLTLNNEYVKKFGDEEAYIDAFEERHHQRFDNLVELVQRIYKKLDKYRYKRYLEKLKGDDKYRQIVRERALRKEQE